MPETVERVTIPPTNIGDTMDRFVKAAELQIGPGSYEIVEGFLVVENADIRLAMVPRGSPPPATDSGPIFTSGQQIGLGPSREKGSGWRLDEIWVQEKTAAAGAKLSFIGTVRSV